MHPREDRDLFPSRRYPMANPFSYGPKCRATESGQTNTHTRNTPAKTKHAITINSEQGRSCQDHLSILFGRTDNTQPVEPAVPGSRPRTTFMPPHCTHRPTHTDRLGRNCSLKQLPALSIIHPPSYGIAGWRSQPR